MILDEPVSALDVSIQASVLNLMSDLQRERGLAYLFISHNLAVVEHISQRVAVMYLGRDRGIRRPEKKSLFTTPLHPYTELLLSAVPVPDPSRPKTRNAPPAGRRAEPGGKSPPGCHFHTRCPYAVDLCKVRDPGAARGQAGASGGLSFAVIEHCAN